MTIVTSILDMNKNDLASLNPDTVAHLLSKEETLHIFLTLGYAWFYDYGAADDGRLGLHAMLKSLNHSDGFINAKGCLKEYLNIRKLFARQIVMRIKELDLRPDYIVGVPTAATDLGNEVAEISGAEKVEMIKNEEGHIKIVTSLEADKSILVIDDICTKGTGYAEAVKEIKSQYPGVVVLAFDIVIVNRGGLEFIKIGDVHYEVRSEEHTSELQSH